MAAPVATVEVVVQFDEVDSFRIGHHSRLVAYLERARLRLLAEAGFSLERPPCAAVVYAMRLDFKKPVRLLDRLQVSSRPLSVEGLKLVLAERIERDGALVMKSRTELAFVDPETGLPLAPAGLFPQWQGVPG